MLMQILSHTPIWVFVLLAILVLLGQRQMRTQRSNLRRQTLVPLALSGLSLYGVLGAFGARPAPVLAWTLALVLLALQVLRRPLPTGTHYDPATGLFTLPGSRLPLLLMLGIFCTKYVVAVTLSLQPALAGQAPFALAVSALYGVFSGVFLGRSLRLWQLAYPAAVWGNGGWSLLRLARRDPW